MTRLITTTWPSLSSECWIHKQLADAKIPQAQTLLKRQIDATDLSAPACPAGAVGRQIDRLVYALYGLTGEEIEIVEGGTN